MLAIRLSRFGKKKHPLYRVIVSEKSKDPFGDYLELLGTYDPHANKAELKAERIKYWLEKGAQPSGTIHNLLVEKKIIEGEKIKVANIKKKKESEKDSEEAKQTDTAAAAKEEPKKEEKPAEPKTDAKTEPENEPKPAAEDKKS